MQFKKNIRAGKNRYYFLFLIIITQMFSFEIMGDLVFNRWKEYKKEQSSIARQLKKDTKSTYKNRVK